MEPTQTRTCSTPECGRAYHAKGLCRRCYERAKRSPAKQRVAPPGPRRRKGEALAYYYAHLDDQTDDCMIWPYEIGSHGGHPRLYIAGRHYQVNVLACEHHHGPRPLGMVACHGPCHTPACWNGRHLSWGTFSQNALDRHRDNTGWGKGEAAAHVKLTEAQVLTILASPEKAAVLAARYEVEYHTILAVRLGRTWKHIPRT